MDASSRSTKRRRRRHERQPPRVLPPPPVAPREAWRERLAPLVPFIGPAVIAVAGVAMLVWTWRTWPDVIVDYGREVYAAWQVSTGKTLYVDVVHFCGPLSVYLNALWFRLFGPGILTLALANAALTGGFVALLYGLLVRVASRLAATTACVTFVTLFACVQYARIGNYNWVCPYSHELPHGVMLSTAALWCLDRYHRTRRERWMAGVGFAIGLVALTKVEVMLAGGLAVGVGLVLTLAVERPGLGRGARLLAVFALGAAIPPAIAFVYFARLMPVEEVLRWPLGHWRAAARPEFTGSAFYRSGMGVDDVGGNVRKLAAAALWYVAALGPVAAGAVALRRTRLHPVVVPGLFVIAAVLAGRFVTIDGWLFTAPRPLPLFMAIAAATSFVGVVRHRGECERASVFVLRTALAVFALVMLAKILLNTRVFHYGFALAMPATAVLVVALVAWLPAAVERLGGRGAMVRAVALGVLVAALPIHLTFVQRLLQRKVHVVGEGGDAFYADARGVPVARLLREIRARVGPAQTLAVLPDGIMVNYLARRSSSTPYYQYDRTTITLWGKEVMEHALEERPPDWVALVDRGDRRPQTGFGNDYFRQGYEWIRANYRPIWQLEPPPFQPGGQLGIELLRRADER